MSGPTDLLKKIFDPFYDKDSDGDFDIDDANLLTDNAIALPFISESSADIYVVGTDTIKDYLDDHILNTVTSPTIYSLPKNLTSAYWSLYQNNSQDVDALKTELSRLIEIDRGIATAIATIKSAVERLEQRESGEKIAEALEIITKQWPNLDPVAKDEGSASKDESKVYSDYINILARKRILIYLDRFGLLDPDMAPVNLVHRITVGNGSVQIDQTNYPGTEGEKIPDKIIREIGKITTQTGNETYPLQGKWEIFFALHEKTPNYTEALTAVDKLFKTESETNPWSVTDGDFDKNPARYLRWATLNLVMAYLDLKENKKQKDPDLDKKRLEFLKHLNFLIEKTKTHRIRDKDSGLFKSYEDFCRKLILLTGLIQFGQSTKTNDQIEAIHLISSRLEQLYGKDNQQYKEDAHELTYYNLAPFLEEFNNTSLDQNWADKLISQSSRLSQVSGFDRIDRSLTSLQDKQDLLRSEYQKTNSRLEQLEERSVTEYNAALSDAGHFSVTSLAAKIAFSRLISQKLSLVRLHNDSTNSLTQNTPQHRDVVIDVAGKVVKQAVITIESSNKEHINSVSKLKEVLNATLELKTVSEDDIEKISGALRAVFDDSGVKNDPNALAVLADLKKVEFAVGCYDFYLKFNELIRIFEDLQRAYTDYTEKISSTFTKNAGTLDPHTLIQTWNEHKKDLTKSETQIVTQLDGIEKKLNEMGQAIPKPPENTSDESLSGFTSGLEKTVDDIKTSVKYARKIIDNISISKIDEQVVNPIERKLTEHGNVSLLLGIPNSGTPRSLGRLGYEVTSPNSGHVMIDGAVLFSFDKDFISGAEIGGTVLFGDPA
ncbi:MAG: hypothetical protein HYU99_01020, partial [Deltaproteobacteria bacterium]|nr:hypothetical protein [Deltaproteobacteria bacterium]